MIAIDLSKQQALDANLEAIQQINFAGNLSGQNNRVMFFTTEEAPEIISHYSQKTVIAL